jgi:hypothetical protein
MFQCGSISHTTPSSPAPLFPLPYLLLFAHETSTLPQNPSPNPILLSSCQHQLIAVTNLHPTESDATMTAPLLPLPTRGLCVMCDQAARHLCSECGNIRYYSAACQQADLPVHEILCGIYKNFDVKNAPSPQHYRAIFCEDIALAPRFIWQVPATNTTETLPTS